MKVAMVSEHASPLAPIGGVDGGGQNIYLAALANVLAEAGHQVTVYTRRDAANLPDQVTVRPRLTVRHVPAGPPTYVPKDELLPHMGNLGTYLADAWSRRPPDVVHSHSWMSGLASLAAARDLERPVVQTFHTLGIVQRRYQGRKDTSPAGRLRLETAIAKTVDAIVATSTGELFELIRLGVRRSAISVIPCGVDLETFTVDRPAAERTSRSRLLVVGRLVERKGVDTVIQALRGIPRTELLVAGGPPADGLRRDPEVGRLRAVARESGVSRRVKFLGQVPHEEVAALMRSSDAVVCVPWYEPFGMVPLEAMACGVPVVVSAVGGLVDAVIHGTTGVHVPPRQPAALATALRKLLADPTAREGFGIAASDRARSRYSWDRIGRETLGVYQRVQAERTGRRRVASSGA
jgi:glycosyltransferase involved in cell wall biosynthesis